MEDLFAIYGFIQLAAENTTWFNYMSSHWAWSSLSFTAAFSAFLAEMPFAYISKTAAITARSVSEQDLIMSSGT